MLAAFFPSFGVVFVATGRGVSRVGYQTAEAMVVRAGYSVEQLGTCLDEYSDLNVLEVPMRRLP